VFFVLQSAGAQRLFDYPVFIQCLPLTTASKFSLQATGFGSDFEPPSDFMQEQRYKYF
jgi:hypothetical protein